MSCDFYFKKWKSTLPQLENILQTDLDYQIEKAHDQLLPNAVHRLTSILCQYMINYNDALECLKNNLQVQKTQYIENILRAILSRIIELKHDLLKLESSHYQFLSTALAEQFQTTYDAEMTDLPNVSYKRSPIIQDTIEKVLKIVKKKKEDSYKSEVISHLLADKEADVIEEILQRFCPSQIENININEDIKYNNISNDTRLKRCLITMIIAHEKLRQTTVAIKLSKQRREAWIKELAGTAQPPARYAIREKSAKLIQRVVRTYFEIKRKRIQDCRLEQMLGMRNLITSEKCDTISKKLLDRLELYDEYEKDLTLKRERIKGEYITSRGEEIKEDYRDHIREWFYKWFESIQIIPNIPKSGALAIFRDEVPDPQEWLEEYNELMIQKKARIGKQQSKFEVQRAKREEKMAIREKIKKQKEEQAFLRKLMKHPDSHPGYYYPHSRKMEHFQEVIEAYHRDWDLYDAQSTMGAKCKYLHELSQCDAYTAAKFELLGEIEEEIKVEQRKLKSSLRKDYENNDEVMPEPWTERKKNKETKMLKPLPSQRFEEKFEALARQGFLVDYPETKLDDYFGDPNFAGEDLRRLLLPAYPQSYEIRNFYWESCYAINHGFRSILLVGPDGSGKKKLVHALASINNAVLFELDPLKLSSYSCTPISLKLLANDFSLCASVVQPSVIYIRHVQKLFLNKNTTGGGLNLNFITRYFIRHLFKTIKKHDKITVIGTCSDPWLTKSKRMLRYFPTVVLLPNNTYSNIVLMLQDWVRKNPVIPLTFDVGCLAQVLQGYSYGYLQEKLTNFMSAERRVMIAAYGLTPMEVYDYILEDKDGMKVNYGRYLTWYSQKTPMGRKEQKHFARQIEFKNAVERYKILKAKKERRAKRSAAASAVSSRSVIP